MDILNRESQKDIRVAEQVEEFSISQLVRAGMRDYTIELENLLQSESRLRPKLALQGMFEGDEATLALITLRTVITYCISQKDGMVLLNNLSNTLSKSVLGAKTLEELDSQHKALSNYIDTAYKRSSESKKLKAKMKSALNLVKEYKEEDFVGSESKGSGIGSILISLLCETIDIIEIIKLDSKSRWEGVQYNNYKPFSYLVRFTDDTKYSLLDLDDSARQFIKPTVLPQLSKPEKVLYWDSKDSNLIAKGRPRSIIKMPKRKQNLKDFKYYLDNNDTAEYKEIHHIIEGTEWTINEDIYNVMSTVFNENIVNNELEMYKGEHFAFNPELIGGLPLRYSLDTDKLIDKSKLGRTKVTHKGFLMFDDDKEGLNRYNTVKNDLLAFNEANLNKALSLQSMFTIAKDYLHKSFWFTYQYDNRSRIYPVQTGLNPQSDSKGKALLKFAGDNGAKPLTERGHYWAKIHGANTFGLDKAELPDKIALIDNMIADGTLVKIGETPLMFIDLWAKTDDPYGFLAFAMEYCKVLRDSKHPYSIATALDATCSGIQIYSGLLRDKEGASAVNVIGTKRNDIYGMVASEANKRLIDKKYERYITYTNGNDEESTIDLSIIANSIAGKITRSISKRNTMTQPYSVTMRGMQDQLKDTFTEMENKGDKFWKGEVWQVSRLLAGVHQDSIDEVVKGAKKGKDFIKYITGLCASRNKGLAYTTKIGFPVYQKNLKTKSCQIASHIWTPNKGMQKVKFRVNKQIGKVNTHSQKNSSAPNFIHSLDSTLLHLVVKRCYERGVTAFALVHDSYGVHPNDIDILNEEIRKAYVEIFSDDVLYNWAIEVLSNAGFTYEEVAEIFSNIEDPMINTLNLKEVYDAVHIFG